MAHTTRDIPTSDEFFTTFIYRTESLPHCAQHCSGQRTADLSRERDAACAVSEAEKREPPGGIMDNGDIRIADRINPRERINSGVNPNLKEGLPRVNPSPSFKYQVAEGLFMY